MESTVNVCFFSILIGFSSAAIDPGCLFDGKFCDPSYSQFDVFGLSADATDMATAIDECYNACFAQKDLSNWSACLDFTVRKTGNRPAFCYLLRSPCVSDSVDSCLGSDPPSCASGPSDCSMSQPAVCPKVAALDGHYARWQCVDINTDPINPYNEDPPEGTLCYQTCSSWVTASADCLPGQLVSTCEAGAWSPTQDAYGGELAYPLYPEGQTKYPTPDADAATALSCGCQPLQVQWPYGPDALL